MDYQDNGVKSFMRFISLGQTGRRGTAGVLGLFLLMCPPAWTQEGEKSGNDSARLTALSKQIDELTRAARFQEAEKPADEAHQLTVRLHGAAHWKSRDAQQVLATVRRFAAQPVEVQRELAELGRVQSEAEKLHQQGKFAEAEPLFRTVLQVRQGVLGDEHSLLVVSLSWLGFNLDDQGKHAEAELLFRKALELCQRVLGDDHPHTARCHSNVANNLHEQGKFAAAETFYAQAISISRGVGGDDHPDTIQNLNNLSVNLHLQGKYSQADAIARRVLEATRRVLGDDHPQTAFAHANVGVRLSAQRMWAEAEQSYRQALRIRRLRLGEQHPETATTYLYLANNLSRQDRFAEAESFYRQALDIRLQVLGAEHPATAAVSSNLGIHLHRQGRFREAEEAFRQALKLRRELLGEEHIDTSHSYHHLARNFLDQGKHLEAEPLCKAAVDSLEAARLRASTSGLDRAGFQEMSPRLTWVMALLHAGQTVRAWQTLEGHLGRGLLDDYSARRMRSRTAEEQKELDALNRQLQQIDQQVRGMLAAKGRLEANRERFETLAKERKSAEAGLAQLAATLQQKEIDDLKTIQASLPSDAALVSWIDSIPNPKANRPGGEHWAFLLKATGDPVAVEMPGTGPNQSWSKADEELPDRVRQFLASRKPGTHQAPVPEDSALAALSRQRLGPLEPHLQTVRHLIVLPSEALRSIPLEALTNRFVVSYAPSGTMLTRLVKARNDRTSVNARNAAPSSTRRPVSLLALGDPVFGKVDGAPADAVAVSLRGPNHAPLPGTRREVEAIAALFPQADKLLGADACLDKIVALEKTLSQYQVLHLATHGVINPEIALESALVLSRDKQSDGRLTAAHMKERWRLQAELVVLSACETGLGRPAGGEGYLGFTQALFLAGARSVILSLWQVDDAATALLMVRFYENLLGKRSGLDKPMPKAEALQEAKHWLRNLTRVDAEKHIAGLPEAARGLKLVPAAGGDPAASDDRPFKHPFYWSAFVLIGDPN
jgi:CHAT domain-containing protein/Tfp pilus assembly protein PilF